MNSENKDEWTQMLREMERADENREKIIKEMRETQKCSKAAIYALHRQDMKTAAAKLETAENVAKKLFPLVSENPELRHGTFSAAVEEYVEARALECFLAHGTLVQKKSFGSLCSVEEYLGGVADLTGELQRWAVIRATQRDVESVLKCRVLCDDIMSCMMEFTLKNGGLRRKFDAVKYAVKRMETILYELSLLPAGAKVDADALAADAGGEAEPQHKKAKTEANEDD